MKKLNSLVFLLFLMTLICSLLIGCTPKPTASSGDEALPGLDGPETADPQTPASENPDEEDAEDGGMDAVEEYTFEVDGNFGVGGN